MTMANVTHRRPCSEHVHQHCALCGTTKGVIYGPPTATGERFPALCTDCRRGTLRAPKAVA